MKELKIFALVVVLTGVLYWGIEPYAHTKLHPHTAAAQYDFSAEDIEQAKHALAQKEATLQAAKTKGESTENAQKDVDTAKKILDDYVAFWADINSIDLAKGDAKKGADTFAAAGCVGCHGVEAAGMPASMDNETASQSFGVVPPDLSTAGKIYDAKFLAVLIKNPTMALKVAHKFNDEKPFPMTAFAGAGGDDINAEISDIVAYLKSVSADYEKANGAVTQEKIFADACQRCHDVKYDKKYAFSNKVSLAAYMGSTPPDLSMMIRSKGDEYLHKFVNDTQKMLTGTSMPRVGLDKSSEDELIAYFQKVGDSKSEQRSSVGYGAMVYFFILGIFAWLWKRKVWSELH